MFVVGYKIRDSKIQRFRIQGYKDKDANSEYLILATRYKDTETQDTPPEYTLSQINQLHRSGI
jgi:hypothetical protein